MAFELPRDNIVSDCCSLSRRLQFVCVTSYCLAQPADSILTYVTCKIASKWTLFSVTQNVASYLIHYSSKSSVTDGFRLTYCCVLRILPELHSFLSLFSSFRFSFFPLWHSLCLFLRSFCLLLFLSLNLSVMFHLFLAFFLSISHFALSAIPSTLCPLFLCICIQTCECINVYINVYTLYTSVSQTFRNATEIRQIALIRNFISQQ